ncbi:MAG TPA: hypothetical protein VFE46_14975 [Pirellulales bacterium]|nr:hypothetical protein [Pirellulales bacterium]
MLGIAALGAVLAGCYGILHDQVSYTISPEYFTKLKFHQFWYANFGWPQRIYASEVGFLASWWVGLIGGWILARLGLDRVPQQRACIKRAFAMVFAIAVVVGAIGLALGSYVAHHTDLNGWKDWRDNLDLQDLPAFVTVAYLHWASYLGALLGIATAGVYVRRVIRTAGI